MVVIQGCCTKPTNDNDISSYYNDHNNNKVKRKEGYYHVLTIWNSMNTK